MGDQIKKNEMGWACDMYREEREDRCIHSLGGETLRERDYLKDLGIDGRIIKWLFKK